MGHILNAIHTWGVARRLGGTVILRIEDHDRGRFRPEFEASILDDIEWLGFQPDAGRVADFRRGSAPFRQSDHDDRYIGAARVLKGKAYWCGCSRKEIAAGGESSPELRYVGTCRDRGLGNGPHRGLRVQLNHEAVEFADLIKGPQRQIPAEQCGDLLLKDRQGNWTYQFAVTVDDISEKVDLVIRGEDLLNSTGRQIILADMLGRSQPPVFYHHPLVVDAGGRKLSKRDNDTGVRELRRAGVSPGQVLGRAAHRGGLLVEERSLVVEELPELFQGLGSSL